MSKFVENEEVFEKYNIIQRKPYADYLTSFLNSNSENGYVLNLNAEWGSGKTTFQKCWYNELKKDHPVIYFDAWKSDFTHDAMTALIDCFHAQLANPISDNKELIKSFFTKSSHFIKKSIPSLAVGYVKHKTGIDNDESLVEDITGTFGIDIAEKEAGDALKEVLKDILEQRKKVEGIEKFKATLSAMADAVIEVSKQSSDEKQYPVYVLIDELDRCRPSYAIEVIETVKHFFNTDNFVFVIATDTEQLQHSIKSIYGNGFDANLYLSRFFNQTVTLPAPELENYLKVKLPTIANINLEDNNLLLCIIKNIFEYHKLSSLREIDKILSSLAPAKDPSKKAVNILSLLVLTMLKKYHQNLYYNFIDNGEIPYKRGVADNTKNIILRKNSNMNNIKFMNVNYPFELFLHNCLFTINNPAQEYIDDFPKLTTNDVDRYAKAYICNYTFSPNDGYSNLDDYKNLVELSCLFD